MAKRKEPLKKTGKPEPGEWVVRKKLLPPDEGRRYQVRGYSIKSEVTRDVEIVELAAHRDGKQIFILLTYANCFAKNWKRENR